MRLFTPFPVPAILLLSLSLLWQTATAQVNPLKGGDSSQVRQTISNTRQSLSAQKDSLKNTLLSQKDSLKKTIVALPDTLIRGSIGWLEEQKKLTREKAKSAANTIITTPAGVKMKASQFYNDLSTETYRGLFDKKNLLDFNGGYVSYQFDFRSNIDTPYVEKDLAQHNTTGQLNFTVAGLIPLRATFWSRQSNSSLFRDITNVNVSFDAGTFRNNLQTAMRSRLLKLAPNLQDSLNEKLFHFKKFQLNDIDDLLKTRFSPQALVEANQVLKVPGITWKTGLSDSLNLKNEDSAKQAAAQFLELYERTMETYNTVKKQTDSLEKVYNKSVAKVKDFQNLINGKWDNLSNPASWKDKLSAYGLEEADVPARYKWLMGVRNFSLGRNTANASELTAKNISVNGISFEYNTWYYLSVTAGAVDFRFRDFSVNGFNRKPQFLYLIRAGLGRLEKNYIILGYYHGKKQLFGNTGLEGINVDGVSLEGKWQIAPGTFVIGEVAKSISPDFRSSPRGKNTTFNLSDNSNQAVSIKIQSYLPATHTRLEGLYKKTGANFQSFSSFQANAAIESWTIKAEQPFFKRVLRISAALKKNEFTNPYIEQDYKSNTVFKSLTATFRKNRWPMITVGYQPMNQLTVFGDRVVESRFQTLTGTAFHTYKLGWLKTSSTVMLNKFFNNQSDTGYLYYNATNIYWTQQFFFSKFTANMGVNYSKNGNYRLFVLEEGFQFPAGKRVNFGFGAKINNLNKEELKVGGYLNSTIRVFKQDNIYLNFERGFLPGFNQGLVRNDMGTIQFVKNF